MTIIITIIFVAIFNIFLEILFWLYKEFNVYNKSFFTFMRTLLLCITLISVYNINDEYLYLEGSYDFNNNLIVHQDSLINYQRTMMDDLANHLWEEHDCDIPQYDGDLKFRINYETEIVDSLNNIKE